MKVCNTCQVEKENTYFHLHDTSPDGRDPQCKSCRYLRAQELKKSRDELDVGEYMSRWAR